MYRYETHLHTCQASACGRSPGAEHIPYYKALGYDGVFITDHFFGGNCAVPRHLPWEERITLFCEGYADAKRAGDREGLKVFFAWEETKDGDDYLIYGLTPEWLLAHPEIEGCTRKRQLELVHEAGGCVIQAHPFRQRDYIRRILLGLDYADGVEVANAGNRPEDDVAAWRYAQDYNLYMTCGSDNHRSGFDVRDPAMTWGIGTETPINCPMDYVKMILERKPVALLCPPERFVKQPGMTSPQAWMLDSREEPVLMARKWF